MPFAQYMIGISLVVRAFKGKTKLAFISRFWGWERTGREELILVGCPEYVRESVFLMIKEKQALTGPLFRWKERFP